MTFQTLSSALDIPTSSRPRRSFLRGFLDALIEGRQLKASHEIAEYLARHPEYDDLSDTVQRPLRSR